MISVGIDIGTTTTQLAFSRLTLAETSRAGQMPCLGITGRTVLHTSAIVFTPLLDAGTLDPVSLAAFLRAEYRRAGIVPAQVETGAVIITGETARKANAAAVLEAIAGLAGDFVVTVAGPLVEGLLAGRGSGAADWSREHFATVTNVDLGGGSANSASFSLGRCQGGAAMAFGGRILELDGDRVRAVTAPGQAILASVGLALAKGDRPALAELKRVTQAMAELTVQLIQGASSPLAERLYLTPPAPGGEDASLMFSGGVGHYFYQPIVLDTVQDVARHGDLGPLLAESLRLCPALGGRRILRPPATRRATVLGACSRALTLSGATIWVDPGILPLRNVPVLVPQAPPPGNETDGLAGALAAAWSRWGPDGPGGPFALALELKPGLDFPGLRDLAGGLAAFARQLPVPAPFIVILDRDYALALGQTLKGLAVPNPLLILDPISLHEGDYLDCGTPLMDGRVVPLVVKTLVFNA